MGWKELTTQFVHGFRDSVSLDPTIHYFKINRRLQLLFVQCFVFNGVLFLVSLLFLDYGVPSLASLVLPLGFNERHSTFIWILKTSRTLFWIYPLYGLSFYVNRKWYDEVSRIAFSMRHRSGKKRRGTQHQQHQHQEPLQLHSQSQSPSQSHQDPGRMVADARGNVLHQINDFVVEQTILFFFLILNSLVSLIPYVGRFLSFFSTSWLYSFKAFNSYWSNKANPMSLKLSYFEWNWAYFLGFGAVYAFITCLLPSFVTLGLWSFLFPFLVSMAITSKIPKIDRKCLHRFPVFYLPKLMNKGIARLVFRILRIPGGKPLGPKQKKQKKDS